MGNVVFKQDIIDAVAKETGLSQTDAKRATQVFIGQVGNALAKGNRVELRDFGTFEVRERKARKGRNPQTGEEMNIPARKAPCFKASKALKERVNK